MFTLVFQLCSSIHPYVKQQYCSFYPNRRKMGKKEGKLKEKHSLFSFPLSACKYLKSLSLFPEGAVIWLECVWNKTAAPPTGSSQLGVQGSEAVFPGAPSPNHQPAPALPKCLSFRVAWLASWWGCRTGIQGCFLPLLPVQGLSSPVEEPLGRGPCIEAERTVPFKENQSSSWLND